MSISLCNDQMLLFKHKTNVYIAPTLRAYQTFHGRKFIQAFTNEGKWVGANILMREVSQHPEWMITFDNKSEIKCDEFLTFFKDGVEVKVTDLKTGDYVDANTNKVDKAQIIPNGKLLVTSVSELESKIDWLFGFEFDDNESKPFVLANGVIVK